MNRRRLAAPVALALLAGCSAGPAAGTPAATGQTATATAGATPTPSPSPSPTPPPDQLTPAIMYSGAAPDLSGYDPSTLRTVVVTGDVLPVRLVNDTLLHTGNYAAPLAPMRAVLQQGDITWFNVEAPLMSLCPDITTGFTLCGEAAFVPPMVSDGVHVVANLASNHISNYGPEGVQETEQHLAAAGAIYSSSAHIAVRTVRGLRFAFIGLNGVGNWVDRPLLAQLIHQARAQADVVIVQFHWGKEYETYPTPEAGIAPDDPRVIGHLAIDDGADLVIGNHPHCVQGSEIYKGKLIAYAHGNFIFDQDWSPGTMEGVVGRYIFSGTTLVGVQYVPTQITDHTWVVHPLDPTTGLGRQILARMQRSSEELAGERPPYHPVFGDFPWLNACT